MGLFLLLVSVLAMVYAIPAREGARDGGVESLHRQFRVSALGLGGGVLITFSLVSHGAAISEIRGAAVFSDYLHLLASGFWVGGLLHFALAFPMFMQVIPAKERRTVLSRLVPRFSVLATLSVGTLIITGLYAAWAQVATVSALPTPYGLTLLTKIGLLLPLLLLGALNLLWVRPRLAQDEGAGRWLRRLVTSEAVLAALVLLCVGMLTSLEPARQAASRQAAEQANVLTFQDIVEGATISLKITPGRVGPNEFDVSLKDRLGSPITNASDVSLRLTYLNADLGADAVAATSLGNGTYVLQKGLLSIAGPWQVELVVRRPDAFDARTAFRFEVASGGASGGTITPSSQTGSMLWGVELVLLSILFLGTGIPLGGWWNRVGAGVMALGVAATLAGFFVLVNLQLPQEGSAYVLRNLLPPTGDSLAIGQRVYTQNCAACHGDTGRGDGPAATTLKPPPLDLGQHALLHPDRDLFRFVKDGFPGTAMPAWGTKLTEEEIWHVVNYIKALATPSLE